MVIRSNISAMNAMRQNGLISNAFADKSEKLSSGYRINRAADDAAGLSISEKMRRQVRGLTQASSNAEEGISYIQTAEGALNEVHDLLQRGNELCVKAGNDTNTDVDREYIQAEIDQIRAEIDRIALDTAFNEMDVFDSSNAGSRNAEELIKPRVMIYSLEYDEIAASAPNDKKWMTADVLQDFAEKMKDTYVPKMLAGIESVFSSAMPGVDGLEIGLTLEFQGENGVLGTCGSSGAGFEMTINLTYLEKESDGSIKLSGDFAQTLIHELTHAVMFDYNTSGMLGGDGADALPGWIVEGMAQVVAGGIGHCNGGGNEAVAWGGDDMLRDWLKDFNTDAYSNYAQGYIASMYLGYLAGGAGAVDTATIRSGVDKVLKDIADGYSLGETIYRVTNGKYQDAADFENKFAKDAFAFAKELLTIGKNGGAGALANDSLGDSSTDLLTISGTSDWFELNIDEGGFIDNVDKYNAAGVDYMNGGGYTTTSGRGLDGSINSDASKKWGSKSGSGGANKAGGNVLSFVQVGSEAGQHIDISRYKLSAKDLGVDSIDVSSADSVGNGIKSFKSAIQAVSQMRSDYGATQNRLEHTVKNLDNVVENVTASESRIRDTDMAKTMVEFSNDNILLQAGQAMMAQANQSNQGVLVLLA